jgi:hypothetical protein
VAQTFTITPFSASYNCGTDLATFTFSGIDLGDNLPLNPVLDFISVDPTSALITVSSATLMGIYQIKITGTLPNSIFTSEIFTLSGSMTGNAPPYFSPALADQIVALGTIVVYLFPATIDVESNPVNIVSVLK